MSLTMRLAGSVITVTQTSVTTLSSSNDCTSRTDGQRHHLRGGVCSEGSFTPDGLYDKTDHGLPHRLHRRTKLCRPLTSPTSFCSSSRRHSTAAYTACYAAGYAASCAVNATTRLKAATLFFPKKLTGTSVRRGPRRSGSGLSDALSGLRKGTHPKTGKWQPRESHTNERLGDELVRVGRTLLHQPARLAPPVSWFPWFFCVLLRSLLWTLSRAPSAVYRPRRLREVHRCEACAAWGLLHISLFLFTLALRLTVLSVDGFGNGRSRRERRVEFWKWPVTTRSLCPPSGSRCPSLPCLFLIGRTSTWTKVLMFLQRGRSRMRCTSPVACQNMQRCSTCCVYGRRCMGPP